MWGEQMLTEEQKSNAYNFLGDYDFFDDYEYIPSEEEYNDDKEEYKLDFSYAELVDYAKTLNGDRAKAKKIVGKFCEEVKALAKKYGLTNLDYAYADYWGMSVDCNNITIDLDLDF